MNLKIPREQLDFLARNRGDRSIQGYIIDIIRDYSRKTSKQELTNDNKEEQGIRENTRRSTE